MIFYLSLFSVMKFCKKCAENDVRMSQFSALCLTLNVFKNFSFYQNFNNSFLLIEKHVFIDDQTQTFLEPRQTVEQSTKGVKKSNFKLHCLKLQSNTQNSEIQHPCHLIMFTQASKNLLLTCLY